MKPWQIITGITVLYFLTRSQNEIVIEETGEITDTEDIPVIVQPPIDENIPDFCPINFADDASSFNFSLAEFHSKDGTAVPLSLRGNIQVLMQQLDVIRNYFGSPLIILSGYRSPQHNENVGGSPSSKHLCGMAADFYIPGYSHDEVQEATLSLMASGQIIDGGLGRYNTFTHYDIGNRRRWDNRTT